MIGEPCPCHPICPDYPRWMIVAIAIMVSNSNDIWRGRSQCIHSTVYGIENRKQKMIKTNRIQCFKEKNYYSPEFDVSLVFKLLLMHSVLSKLRICKSLIRFNAVPKFLICFDCFTRNIFGHRNFTGQIWDERVSRFSMICLFLNVNAILFYAFVNFRVQIINVRIGFCVRTLLSSSTIGCSESCCGTTQS